MTKPTAPAWKPKKPSTMPSDNSAPASLAKDVEMPFTPGTCTRRRFAKRKSSFPRSDEPWQEPLVDRHSHHSIHSYGMYFLDLFLPPDSPRPNELPPRGLAQPSNRLLLKSF